MLSSHTSRLSRRTFATAVYAWGASAAGLAPHKPPTADVMAPLDVTASIDEYMAANKLPAGTTVSSVVAGRGDNSGFVFSNGQAVITGDNKYSACTTIPSTIPVKSLSLGPFNYSAISTDNKLYSWGYPGSSINGFGQLGLGPLLSSPDADHVATPTLVDSLVEDATPPTAVSHGNAHTIMLTVTDDTAEVLTAGAGTFGRLGNPEPVDLLHLAPVEYLHTQSTDSPFTTVAAGSAFSLALNASGEVFSYGKNDKGQLGHGGGMSMDMYAMESLPTLIETFSLQNVRIVDVSAGYDHSAAVSEEGEVYIWGGKSGFLEPDKVSGLQGIQIVSVQCGYNFTVCCDVEGRLYTMSHGGGTGGVKVGATGDGKGKGGVDPIRMRIEGKVTQYSVGWRHVLAVVDQ